MAATDGESKVDCMPFSFHFLYPSRSVSLPLTPLSLSLSPCFAHHGGSSTGLVSEPKGQVPQAGEAAAEGPHRESGVSSALQRSDDEEHLPVVGPDHPRLQLPHSDWTHEPTWTRALRPGHLGLRTPVLHGD